MKFSKKIIITMFILLFVFVIVTLALFWFKGEIPDTLVTCVFGFFGVEGGCLAMIKATETKHQNKNESEDNNNGGFDTDSDSGPNIDNGNGDNISDTVLEGKDRGEEAHRGIKVGVYRRFRR